MYYPDTIIAAAAAVALINGPLLVSLGHFRAPPGLPWNHLVARGPLLASPGLFRPSPGPLMVSPGLS